MTALRSAPLWLLVALTACEAQATHTGQAADPGLPEPGQDAIVPGYTVDVEVPPKATRGQEALARVRVHPTEPWHMNLEYPVKLRLQAPDDVELVAPLLRKADAERYDDQALEFSVLFTPLAQGSRKIHAELDFAVCGATTCGPVTESIELAFEVGCRSEDTGLC